MRDFSTRPSGALRRPTMPSLATLIDARLAQLPHALALEWPGGRAGSAAAPVRLHLHDRRMLAPLATGRIGTLADAYVRGELEIEGRLPDVMEVAASLAGDPVERGQVAPWLRWLRHWRSRRLHVPWRDAEQVRFHYDIDDAFFALWLDPRRVYSCAYFEQPGTTLAQAQEAKLDLVCRKLLLAPGQRLLDVGAGWGALLCWAAEHYGVTALGITLSRHQHAHVERLIGERGLRGRVEVRLLDYRELREPEGFDRIASIGMFEHVGQARLTAYFETLRRLLRPGGLVLNHGITAGGLHNDQLGAGIGAFIDDHIFPGGELVHVSRVARHIAEGGLELLDAENLRPHYARTLWAWSDALERRRERATAIAGAATVRAYLLYLAGSAMAFERGWLALHQMLAARPDGRMDGHAMRGAQSDYPFSRGYMFAARGIAPRPT